MQSRITAGYALPVLLSLAGLTTPSLLRAQTNLALRPDTLAIELGHRARSRAVRWAKMAPLIHCGPAPLMERPGAAAEISRPRVAPLEESFLDAALVKRRPSRASASAAVDQ